MNAVSTSHHASNNENMNRRLVVGEYHTTTPSRPMSRCKKQGNHSPYTENIRMLNKVRSYQTTQFSVRKQINVFLVCVMACSQYYAVNGAVTETYSSIQKKGWMVITPSQIYQKFLLQFKEKATVSTIGSEAMRQIVEEQIRSFYGADENRAYGAITIEQHVFEMTEANTKNFKRHSRPYEKAFRAFRLQNAENKGYDLSGVQFRHYKVEKKVSGIVKIVSRVNRPTFTFSDRNSGNCWELQFGDYSQACGKYGRARDLTVDDVLNIKSIQVKPKPTMADFGSGISEGEVQELQKFGVTPGSRAIPEDIMVFMYVPELDQRETSVAIPEPKKQGTRRRPKPEPPVPEPVEEVPEPEPASPEEKEEEVPEPVDESPEPEPSAEKSVTPDGPSNESDNGSLPPDDYPPTDTTDSSSSDESVILTRQESIQSLERDFEDLVIQDASSDESSASNIGFPAPERTPQPYANGPKGKGKEEVEEEEEDRFMLALGWRDAFNGMYCSVRNKKRRAVKGFPFDNIVTKLAELTKKDLSKKNGPKHKFYDLEITLNDTYNEKALRAFEYYMTHHEKRCISIKMMKEYICDDLREVICASDENRALWENRDDDYIVAKFKSKHTCGRRNFRSSTRNNYIKFRFETVELLDTSTKKEEYFNRNGRGRRSGGDMTAAQKKEKALRKAAKRRARESTLWKVDPGYGLSELKANDERSAKIRALMVIHEESLPQDRHLRHKLRSYLDAVESDKANNWVKKFFAKKDNDKGQFQIRQFHRQSTVPRDDLEKLVESVNGRSRPSKKSRGRSKRKSGN